MWGIWSFFRWFLEYPFEGYFYFILFVLYNREVQNQGARALIQGQQWTLYQAKLRSSWNQNLLLVKKHLPQIIRRLIIRSICSFNNNKYSKRWQMIYQEQVHHRINQLLKHPKKRFLNYYFQLFVFQFSLFPYPKTQEKVRIFIVIFTVLIPPFLLAYLRIQQSQIPTTQKKSNCRVSLISERSSDECLTWKERESEIESTVQCALKKQSENLYSSNYSFLIRIVTHYRSVPINQTKLHD